MIKIFGIELKMFFIISTWGYCVVPEDWRINQILEWTHIGRFFGKRRST
jgi:hypothetical protein